MRTVTHVRIEHIYAVAVLLLTDGVAVAGADEPIKRF